MGPDVGKLLDFLDAEGQLEPPDVDVWPTDSDDPFDTYQFNWSAFFGGSRNEGVPLDFDADLLARARDLFGSGEPTGEDAKRAVERRADVCAWYRPIHFHGPNWGIFVRQDCMAQIALDIMRFMSPWVYPTVQHAFTDAHRMAFASLFLHEQYHHKTESFAVRLHVARGRPAFRTYWNNVYAPAFATTGALEEGLANANSLQRLGEKAYSRLVHSESVKGAKSYLEWHFPLEPPGYNLGTILAPRDRFAIEQNLLKAQVDEGRASPSSRPADVWSLAPNMNESLYGLRSEIWVVVPPGARVHLPVFAPPRTVASRDLEAALRTRHGYEVVKGGGKGSHVKLKAPGRPTLILPGNRKDLSPVVLKTTAKTLGYPNADTMLERLGC